MNSSCAKMVSSALVSRAVADVDAARPPRGTGGTAMTPSTPDLQQAGLRLDIDDAHPAGAVATVTLDRPQRRNAMTPSMWWGLAEHRRVAAAERAGGGRARRGPVLLRGTRPAAAHPGRRARRRSVPRPDRPGIRGVDRFRSRKVSPGCAGRTSSRSRQSAGTPSAAASSWRSPATSGCSPTTPNCA